MNAYTQEIKVVLISAVFGFLLLFPRFLLVEQWVPSLTQFLEDAAKKISPSTTVEFKRAETASIALKKDIKSASRAMSPLRLEGIIFDAKGESSILINGQILDVGDAVEGYTVLKVLPAQVMLEKGGALYLLNSDSELKRIRSTAKPAAETSPERKKSLSEAADSP